MLVEVVMLQVVLRGEAGPAGVGGRGTGGVVLADSGLLLVLVVVALGWGGVVLMGEQQPGLEEYCC